MSNPKPPKPGQLVKTVVLLTFAGIILWSLAGSCGQHSSTPSAPSQTSSTTPANPNDPNAQQKYLADLRSQGITGGNDTEKIELGQLACNGYHHGMDKSEIITMLRSNAQINSHVADTIVISAELDLCL